MLYVRRASEDYHWVRHIEIKDGCKPHEMTPFNDFLHLLGSVDTDVIVGSVGHGTVVCFAAIHHGRKSSRFVDFCVDPEWRRGRVGTRLIRYAKHLARERGSRKLKYRVDEYNLPGQLFLKSNGFKCKKQSQFDGMDVYDFHCKLGEDDSLVEAGGIVPPHKSGRNF